MTCSLLVNHDKLLFHSFHVNRRLFLDGFGINLSGAVGITHNVILSVRRAQNQPSAVCKTSILSPRDPKSNPVARVDLAKSLEIQADVIYHVEGSVSLSVSTSLLIQFISRKSPIRYSKRKVLLKVFFPVLKLFFYVK